MLAIPNKEISVSLQHSSTDEERTTSPKVVFNTPLSWLRTWDVFPRSPFREVLADTEERGVGVSIITEVNVSQAFRKGGTLAKKYFSCKFDYREEGGCYFLRFNKLICDLDGWQ